MQMAGQVSQKCGAQERRCGNSWRMSPSLHNHPLDSGMSPTSSITPALLHICCSIVKESASKWENVSPTKKLPSGFICVAHDGGPVKLLHVRFLGVGPGKKAARAGFLTCSRHCLDLSLLRSPFIIFEALFTILPAVWDNQSARTTGVPAQSSFCTDCS